MAKKPPSSLQSDQILDDLWDDDLEEDITPGDLHGLVVYSRDWTVETVFSQIQQGNIDLNPKFQRRHAWSDSKRSRLIESLILRVPVPEVVLAEDKSHRGSFLVLDGKQRLSAIAGFLAPEKFEIWSNPKLSDLHWRKDLNGIDALKMKSASKFSGAYRNLLNADLRCTVISHYPKDDVLYDIFHRLNTSSVPLSSQELRQSLMRGPFANYLVQATNKPCAVHRALGIDGPDNRLRDVEMLLRFIAFDLHADRYRGNLRKFLDTAMSRINKSWSSASAEIKASVKGLEAATDLLEECLGKHIGRKYVGNAWEGRFNKVLFEVEAYYFARLARRRTSVRDRKRFKSKFQALCKDRVFRASIESTTKSNEKYRDRYLRFGRLIRDVFGLRIPAPSFSVDRD